ncbi:uncharacterized protein LOC129282589 [Lytechinus pictus]|uniref:uncharacterized protein LOC129282589 n=1 Tax=Lytechinus pictus TaxID=7653 RepID=UPI0030B9FC33
MATRSPMEGSYQEDLTRQWKQIAERPDHSRTHNPPLPDPNDMQTGAFLQLFTNSVNTALHKQHCTCKGKSYDSKELFAKSNPGLFGPNGQLKVTNAKKPGPLRQNVEVKLPPVATSKASEDIIKEATRDLKHQLKKHVSDTGSVQVSPRFCKPLGDSGLVELTEELRLPHIMEIRDRTGNNWKIIQDASNKSRQRLKESRIGPDWKSYPAISTQKLQLLNDPINSPREKGLAFPNTSQGQGIDSNAIDAVLRQNTPILQVRVPVLDDYSEDGFDDQCITLPDLRPRCQQALTHTCTSEAATPKDVPDEMTRKILLGRWAASVRTGKMTYSEYLRKVSLMSMLQRSDTMNSKQDMFQSRSLDWSSAAREKRPRTRSLEEMLEEEHLPKRLEIDGGRSQLNSRDNTHIGHKGRERPIMTGVITPGDSAKVCSQPLPPELERLYTRSSSRVPTLDIGQSLDEYLPTDFLVQERHKLRMQYPMYNSKRENERLYASNQFTSKSLPSQISFHGDVERPMTNEPREITLQSDIAHTGQQKRKSKPRRLNSRLGYNAICITGGRIPTKANTSDEIEALSELQRQYLEQQTLNDVTPDNVLPRLYAVPHQPPTTPVDATLASVSLPEILAQMAEGATVYRISEETLDKEPKGGQRIPVPTKVPGISEPKKNVQGESVNIVTIEAETSCLKASSKESICKDSKDSGNSGSNADEGHPKEEPGNDKCENDAAETFSLKSELLEGKSDYSEYKEGIKHDSGTETNDSNNNKIRKDLKTSIKQLEISDVNGLESQMTTISSRSLERMMARLPSRHLKSRDKRSRRSRTIGTASGLMAKRSPMTTKHVVFVSPAFNQSKA